ncbi:MAG: adenosine kinase [Paracoccaceae bacterium]
MGKNFQVVGIGNAIVDIFSKVDEGFLKVNCLDKGVMHLTSYEKAEFLLKNIKVSRKVAGGSAANTIVGLSQMGLETAYIGKVGDDEWGQFFENDLISNQVFYSTKKSIVDSKNRTGHCLVLITPDGERTMNTYLGVTEFLSKDDLDKKLLRDCDWLYLEGYRYDGLDSKAAFSIAIRETKEASGKVALSLSDPFCVDRHRKDFLNIIREGIDLIFCNEQELISLTQEKKLEPALKKALDFNCDIACTASSQGVFIRDSNSWLHIPTKEVTPDDATGAGDFFAAGFLYALINEKNKKYAGRLGNMYASEIIKNIGCRLDKEIMLNLKNK